MARQILGKVVPIAKGTYNSSTQYSILDIVEYNGSSYIAKQNVQGQAPTNTTYWQLLARQGDKPVYKVDYLTDAEMDEIVADIISDSTNTFNQNVTAKTTAFNNNATDKTTAFNSNATNKTSDFNTNASSKTTAFNSNATSKTNDYNSNASSLKDDFDRNAGLKTTAYDDNATSKVNAYNSNASDKTTAFNNNATAKTEAFNDNYDSKIELFDEHSEELQEELDRYKTLENALPHATGEGATITLDDTAKSPLTMDLEPTELSQASTPSPSSPQDIHVISGNNNIIVRNKNILDEVWENGGVNSADGSNENNGDTTRIRTKNHILVNPSTTYVLSFDNTNVDSNGARVVLYNKNKEFISVLWYQDSQGDKWSFATTSETYYIRFTAKHTNNSNWDLNNTKFQLEDNTATSYVPHEAQIAPLNLGDIEYCKIGDNKDRFMKPSGTQLFDKSNANVFKGYVSVSGSKIVNSQTENDDTLYISIKPNTKYTIQKIQSNAFYVCTSTNIENNTSVSNAVNKSSNTSYTITSGANDVYLCVTYHINSDSLSEETIRSSIMINEGETALPYEPFNDGKWYLKKNINKIVLDGTENYEFENNNRFSYRILNTQAEAPIKLATVNTQSPVYSKYFNASTPNVTWSNTTNHLISLSNTINAFAITKKDVASSVEDFKTWLTTHNTPIYYPLATPQYILLNDTLQSQLETIYNKLLSYQEQTNISQVNNDLPFNIKAKAVKDLNSLIEI